jgi:DNA-directed RNA polymerase subunit F
MARLARMDVGSSSYSSPTSYSTTSYSTRYLSLEEALKLVISGEMGSSNFFSQAPKQIKELMDEVSTASFNNKFQNLNHESQKKVCSALLNLQKPIDELIQQIVDRKMEGKLFYHLASKDLRDVLDNISSELFKGGFVSLDKNKQSKVCTQLLSRQQLTFHEILELVTRGELEGKTFYNQISTQLREIFDNMSQTVFQKTFSKLNKKEQSEICKILLELVPQVASEIKTSSSSQIKPKIEIEKNSEKTPKEIAPLSPPRKGIIQRIKHFIGWS